jgi:mRNA-degrading endonuclease toxin of MazEF toxin-antitoxin module
MIEPGEVYLADLREAGRRPVIVVSTESLNRGHYALVVVCTSGRFALRSRLPNCVAFQAGHFGFTTDCVAQCENILSINKRQLDLDTGPIGVLDGKALREVIKAIGHVIESDCEPV